MVEGVVEQVVHQFADHTVVGLDLGSLLELDHVLEVAQVRLDGPEFLAGLLQGRAHAVELGNHLENVGLGREDGLEVAAQLLGEVRQQRARRGIWNCRQDLGALGADRHDHVPVSIALGELRSHELGIELKRVDLLKAHPVVLGHQLGDAVLGKHLAVFAARRAQVEVGEHVNRGDGRCAPLQPQTTELAAPLFEDGVSQLVVAQLDLTGVAFFEQAFLHQNLAESSGCELLFQRQKPLLIFKG